MVTYSEDKSLISPEGILGVLFHMYRRISFRYSDLHKAFYDVRMKERYHELLKDFWFSGSSVNPFSEELSLALTNLQVAALARKNPDMVEYSTTSEFENTYQILTKDIDPEIIEQVKVMCEEVKRALPPAA